MAPRGNATQQVDLIVNYKRTHPLTASGPITWSTWTTFTASFPRADLLRPPGQAADHAPAAMMAGRPRRPG